MARNMNTATAYNPNAQTQMIINISDASIVSRIKAFLKLVPGVDEVRVKKPKTKLSNVITPELAAEIAEAREEMARGECITFETMKDFDAYFDNL